MAGWGTLGMGRAALAGLQRCRAVRTRLPRRWASQIVALSQFDTVEIRSALPVVVRGLNPLAMDTAHLDERDQLGLMLSQQPRDNFELTDDAPEMQATVETANDRVCITIPSEFGQADASLGLHVWLPFSCNIDVQTEGSAGVELHGLEGGRIAVRTVAGSCHLAGVKAPSYAITSDSGDVTSSVLQGDIDVTLQSGNLTLKRLMALESTLRLHAGNCKVEALYGTVRMELGGNNAVHVGDCHGNCFIHGSTASVFLGTVDGHADVELEAGDVDAYLLRVDAARFVNHQGKVQLRLSPDLSATLRVPATSNLHLTDEFGALPPSEPQPANPDATELNVKVNAGEVEVPVHAPEVTLGIQSYISAMWGKRRGA
ncbi:uncharacterized protein MONBRDRAFT_25481 [Monosiga brevicollis MX1]|uniref:DUF4097 domain-containing protein n=1 Tax=Monosiga brevicollis TaxID=81824 RepID=A9UZJ4_MONBE|nr:uncharacterized protein MONBRDRAFT_25481 [Monosiga brevicollis MX1]EDQ89380.1 predicted protein [Monosiga brevicollis MX1]|eukprot:XP_001745956.1 hypothetical protein [Monosiga brevicollis MX1]